MGRGQKVTEETVRTAVGGYQRESEVRGTTGGSKKQIWTVVCWYLAVGFEDELQTVVVQMAVQHMR
jgi:hypothetical protein